MKHHFCVTTNPTCNATLQMNFPLSEEVFIPSYKHLNTTTRMPFLLVSAAFYSTNYLHGPSVTLTHPLQAAHLQWLMLTDSCVSTANCLLLSLPKASETVPAVQVWIHNFMLDFSWRGGEGSRVSMYFAKN